jgi:hypothetical protein
MPSSPDALVLRMQYSPVTGQLLGIVVDRVDQAVGRDASLPVEYQIFPQGAQVLKIRGDVPRVLLIAPVLAAVADRWGGKAVLAAEMAWECGAGSRPGIATLRRNRRNADADRRFLTQSFWPTRIRQRRQGG